MITAMPRIAIASHDFQGMVETFRDRFGLPVIDISETTVSSLGAKLAMCVPAGGSNIELMSPADPAAPLSQSLSRFLDRLGVMSEILRACCPNGASRCGRASVKRGRSDSLTNTALRRSAATSKSAKMDLGNKPSRVIIVSNPEAMK